MSAGARPWFQGPFDALGRVDWSALGRSALEYAAPAFLLQGLLLKLGGGALWLPLSWRGALLALGTLLGQAIFSHARHRYRPAAADAEPGGEPAARTRPERIRGRKAREAASRESAAARDRRHAAMRYGALCAVLVLGHVFLRVRCIEPIVIPTVPAATIDIDELPFHFDVKAVGRDGSEVRAANGSSAITNGPYVGTVLVPLRYLDPHNRALVRAAAERGQNLVKEYASASPEDLLDVLAREHLALSITIALFVVLYFGLVSAASAAYGYSFDLREEGLAYLIERFLPWLLPRRT